MKRFILLFVTLFTLVLGFSALHAEDISQTCANNPNDPSGLPQCYTSDDNECYTGGVLYREENQDGCPTVWDWKAGWYLARYNRGQISRANFPQEFESVLPSLSAASANANSCSYTYTSATGNVVLDANWHTALTGQDNLIAYGNFKTAGFQFINTKINSSAVSISASPPAASAGDTLLDWALQIRDASNTVLLTITCSVTNN